MENRFVHSYWSAPAFNNRWNIDCKMQNKTNMWYFALSAAYLKSLNQKIVLHTDSFGKELLGHIPYDEIYLTLDNIAENPSIWACGKMYAMKEEPISAIHIDGDVFITSEEVLNKINSEDFDLLVQNYEQIRGSHIEHTYYQALYAIRHLNFPEQCSREYKSAYNTGILSFHNQDFKNLFLNVYFDMCKQISNNERSINLLKDKMIIPDLIIEQQYIHDLANSLNIKVKFLLDLNKQNYAGYSHIVGTDKYLQLKKCKEQLHLLNPELYLLCEEKEKEYATKIG